MLEPEVEARPWDEQLALDDESYRAQLAYLFERSAFYRDKLTLAGFASARGAGGLADIAALPLTDKREIRATCTPENPIGTHLCATPAEIVRIYSTSGTTGAPSYIPLTAGDLDNWVDGLGAQLRRLGRRRRPAHRLAPTTPARSSPAPRSHAFDRIGLCHIPVGTGNTERLMLAIELLRPEAAVLTPSYAAHLVEWAAERDVRPRGVERRARARRGRAGRRRAGLPRAARGGLGREGHRGDGDRRHRRVAVGRVRGAGRHAPRRARLRARRADRPRDGRRARARRRRRRRARAHAPPPSRRAAAALPHPRPRAGADEPVPVRAHGPARALHRPHRRHADRARRQRLPVGRARGGERVRARRQRPHPRQAAGARA